MTNGVHRHLASPGLEAQGFRQIAGVRRGEAWEAGPGCGTPGPIYRGYMFIQFYAYIFKYIYTVYIYMHTHVRIMMVMVMVMVMMVIPVMMIMRMRGGGGGGSYGC